MKNSAASSIRIKAALFFILCFLTVFFLTNMTPLIADDFNYAFGWVSTVRVRSIRDVYLSMKAHRMISNGRVFAHGFVSLFTIYPRWVFSLANAAVICAFLGIVFRFFQRIKIRDPLLALCAFTMMVWILMPVHGQVFFWLAGACNYAWALTVTGFVLLESVDIDSEEGKPLKLILMLIPAFIAGAWSEHISLVMLVLLGILCLRDITRKKHFPWGKALILLAGCAGYLFLWISPSMIGRWLAKEKRSASPSFLSRILKMIPGGWITLLLILIAAGLLYLLARKRMGRRNCLFAMTKLFTVLCLFAFAASAVMAWINGGFYGFISSSRLAILLTVSFLGASLWAALQNEIKEERLSAALLLAGAGFSILPILLLADYIPARVLCVTVTLSILSGIMLLDSLPKPVPGWINTALIIVFLVFFVIGAADIRNVYHESQIREQKFREAAEGDKRVVLSPYSERTKYSAQYGQSDLVYDANWPNGVMADFYDVIRIVVVDNGESVN